MNENQVTVSKDGSVFHESFCPYINRIKPENRRLLREAKAIRKGYCECKFCRSVRGLAYKYKKSNDFKGLTILYDAVDNAMCVRTAVGFWKLIWRDQAQNWALFHMNHFGQRCFNENKPDKELMRGSFHKQARFLPTTSISKALEYIRSHDTSYRIAETDIRKMPKNTRQQRLHYRQQRNRKRKESIDNVMRIISTL